MSLDSNNTQDKYKKIVDSEVHSDSSDHSSTAEQSAVDRKAVGSNPTGQIKVKREVKSKLLLSNILIRISRGETSKDIYESYGWKKQRLYNHIRRLKSTGMIILKSRSNVALYELTDKGKFFLIEHEKFLSSSIRLHHVEYIADILNMGTIQPENQWTVKNWLANSLKMTDCTLVWNHSTIRFSVANLFGTNAFEILDRAKKIVGNIMGILKERYSMEIGEIKLDKKPHFAVQTAMADQIDKNMTFKSDIGEIDASNGASEVEYYDPLDANNFIYMPRKIQEMESHLIRQTEIMDKLSRNIELHLEVMNEMKDTLKAIRDSLKR